MRRVVIGQQLRFCISGTTAGSSRTANRSRCCSPTNVAWCMIVLRSLFSWGSWRTIAATEMTATTIAAIFNQRSRATDRTTY